MDATELAASRARNLGVTCVFARNVNHLGRLGEYTSALAEQGFVALLLVNCQGSGQLLPPFGGIDRRLTNNPISVAAPGGADPVLLDIALSVVAEAKVWLAKARGETLPEGCVLDADGRPSNDPDALFDGGVLLPVGGTSGGHKAYGLIVLVDIIAGLLSGGGVCRADAPADFSNALFLLALDVEPLVARGLYESEFAALRAYIKSSRPAPGVDEILLPGEFEARTRARRASAIEIETTTWQELGRLAQRLDVTPPEAKS
jgi:LDH2 family malate/lactate/ureidoglycolate dehydrogenase